MAARIAFGIVAIGLALFGGACIVGRGLEDIWKYQRRIDRGEFE